MSEPTVLRVLPKRDDVSEPVVITLRGDQVVWTEMMNNRFAPPDSENKPEPQSTDPTEREER